MSMWRFSSTLGGVPLSQNILRRQTLSAKGKTVTLWWRNLTDITLTKCSRFTSNKIYHHDVPLMRHTEKDTASPPGALQTYWTLIIRKVPDKHTWVAFYNVTDSKISGSYKTEDRLRNRHRVERPRRYDNQLQCELFRDWNRKKM